MAPTISKPSRPSFSPPRPGKSKVTKSTNGPKKSGKPTTTAVAGTSNGESSNSKIQKKSIVPKSKSKVRLEEAENGGVKKKSKNKTKDKGKGRAKQVQRGAKGTMRAFLGDSDDNEDEDVEEDVPARSVKRRKIQVQDVEDGALLNELAATLHSASEDEPHAEEHEDQRDSNDSDEDAAAEGMTLDLTSSPLHAEDEDDTRLSTPSEAEPEGEAELNFSSPEPDFVLAEVLTTSHSHSKTATSTTPTDTDYPVPLPLVHRIMHANFSSPETTTLSSDARALMGKYIEVFVKEAVRRCVDEKKERARRGGGVDEDGDAEGNQGVGDTGWLEVEDLERVGCQLVMDF